LIDRPKGSPRHARQSGGIIEIGPSTIDGKPPVEFR
jgi:hypothetical protein